jgi:hypothetical protein
MARLLIALLLSAEPTASLAATGAWDFRVLLDGREVGRHQFTLDVEGERRELRSAAQFAVRVLFIDAYRYLHDAVERWNGDCLQSLDARTETNGRREIVSAAMQEGRLVVVRPDGRELHEGCVMSFAYWNPEILNARRLLNSQTGELMPVTITNRGEEMLVVRGEPRTATRHRISAEKMQIDLWYANGQWLALEALVPGGRRLRYELI